MLNVCVCVCDCVFEYRSLLWTAFMLLSFLQRFEWSSCLALYWQRVCVCVCVYWQRGSLRNTKTVFLCSVPLLWAGVVGPLMRLESTRWNEISWTTRQNASHLRPSYDTQTVAGEWNMQTCTLRVKQTYTHTQRQGASILQNQRQKSTLAFYTQLQTTHTFGGI